MKIIKDLERSRFSVGELATRLDLSLEATVEVVKELSIRNIVRRVDGATTFPAFSSLRESDRFYYNFCGVVAFKEFVFLIGPKYLQKTGFDDEHFSLVLKVLKKDNDTFGQLSAPNRLLNSGESRSALLLAIVDAYIEHGLLSRAHHYPAVNGNGLVSWPRTIDRCEPVFQHGRPIYVDVVTQQSTIVTDNLVSDVHRAAVAECFEIIDNSYIGEIVGVDDRIYDAPRLSILGSQEYLISVLNQALATEFVTWKQEVIGLLIRYLNQRDLDAFDASIFLLGTNAFHMVWERVCKKVIGDHLAIQLPAEVDGQRFNSSNEKPRKLFDEIPKPHWNLACGEEILGADSLIPDTVKIGAFDDIGTYLLIVDAKYYTPVFGSSVIGAPGIESITKQFLYQRAFSKFVLQNQIERVANVFVSPSHSLDLERPAEILIPSLFDEPSPMQSKIGQWMLPAKYVFESYLSGDSSYGSGLTRRILISESG